MRYLIVFFSTISFKDSNESYTNVYPDWFTLRKFLQGIKNEKCII